MYFQSHNTIPQPFCNAFEQQKNTVPPPNPSFSKKEADIFAASKPAETQNNSSSFETMLLILMLMDYI